MQSLSDCKSLSRDRAGFRGSERVGIGDTRIALFRRVQCHNVIKFLRNTTGNTKGNCGN